MDPIISVAVETAGKAVVKEVKMLYGVKEEIEGMKIELQRMQSFLDDTDRHDVTSQSQRSREFRQLVSEVREASLDVEDIFDTYMVKLVLKERSGVMNLIKKLASTAKHCRDIHAIGSKVEAVKSRLSNLKNMQSQIYGREEVRVAAAQSSGVRSKHRSYPHIHDRNVVGLDLNIDQVVGMLLRGGDNDPFKVVSIYGMGGLGKTTLAKKVYGDGRVRKHFDEFAWVYVSQQFNERDVWESTLAQLTSKGTSKLQDEELFAELSRVLKDHKCLVVLDDVWSIEDWEKLHDGLQLEETSTSKILLTTRKPIVAENANRRGSYGGLKPLDNEKSLELLRKIALEGRDPESTADLKSMEDWAKSMLRHCGGLPLAIIVLGGILATRGSLIEWQTVPDNVNTYLRRGKGDKKEQGLGVHEVLAYSYYDLPHQLKNCFLYLSQYPEDYEIPTNTLVKMWMAEGFISVEYDGEWEETVEDVAERYLNELVGRCVVEIGETGSTGRTKTCRLHDLMREVCLSKAKDENFIRNIQREGPSNAAPNGKIRRLSFFGDRNSTISLSGNETNSQVRSLILCGARHSFAKLASVDLADSFKLLRMLFLEWIDMRQMNHVSKEIGKLIHLKCLSFKMSRIYDFPSMDKLGCMETLDLRVYSIGKETCLLKVCDIWKMKRLRHLYFPSQFKRLRHLYFPSQFIKYHTDDEKGEIEDKPTLQTLVNFPPPNCEVGEILKFPNLRKLDVTEGEKFWEILKKNTSFNLNRLHSLCLEECYRSHGKGRPKQPRKEDLRVLFKRCPHLYKLDVTGPIEKFPQLNQFPKELTKLILSCSGIQDPTHIETTLGNLPNLRILGLYFDAFSGEQLSFKKGTFLKLKSLRLESLDELNSWTVEEGAMPNLEHLKFDRVAKLASVPEGLRYIDTLNKLEFSFMPLQFAERMSQGGADFDSVKHIPSIIFYYFDESREDVMNLSFTTVQLVPA